MKSLIVKLIRSFRKNTLFRFFRKLAGFYVRIFDGNDCACDPELNGEYDLLKKISKQVFDGAIFLDVGANVGDWTKKCLSCSDCIEAVYCFEVVKPTYQKLITNLQGIQRAKCRNFGLSDSDFETEVSYIPDSDSGSSINVLPWEVEMEKLPALLKKGDNVLLEEGIANVFLLKIDTEGHEYSVLKGFEESIRENRIKCIQFEYGYTYIPSRKLLGDVYDLLVENGYSIGRVQPGGVLFRKYNPFRDENFKMSNYFATCDSKIEKLISTEE